MFISQSLVTKFLKLCLLVLSFAIKIRTVGGHLRPTDNCLEILSQSSSEFWIPSSFPTAIASNISEKCIGHTEDYVTAFRNQLPWAIKMYESSGTLKREMIHTGSGNVHHESGLFDDCLSVQSPDFQGQYCSVFFDLKPVLEPESKTGHSREGEPYEFMSNFRMPSASFCLPSTCSARDLRSSIAQLVGYRVVDGKNFSIVTLSNEDFCFTKEKISNKNITSDYCAMMALMVFCLLGFFVLSATIHEFWRENYLQCPVDSKREKLGIRYLNCFSALNNSRKLLSTRDEVDSISCLHGIRFLTTCWIVFQHAFMEIIGRNSYNKKMNINMISSWMMKSCANATVAVDTFFLLSGLLVTYSQMRKLAQNQGVFNLKQFYLHRYFRLTSLYAIVIGFIVTLYPYLGSGPDWNYVQQITKSTRKYWWTSLLYIHNYLVFKNEQHMLFNPSTSLTETWYLACEMQMFWISPLFIYPLWRWKRAGLIWTITSLLAFMAANVIIFAVNDIPPVILLSRPTDVAKLNDYARLHYMKIYGRIPPYLIGILLGWFLHKVNGQKLHLNKYLVAIGWFTATMLCIAVLYGLTPYLDEKEAPIIEPFFRISYGAFHRPAWALAIGWMIFACTHGYGGYVQSYLSWKLFMPLSRLSYAVYLIHPIYMKAYDSFSRKPLYTTEITFLTTGLGILAMVLLMAFSVSVAVEMPFLNLDKLLIRENNKCSAATNGNGITRARKHQQREKQQ